MSIQIEVVPQDTNATGADFLAKAGINPELMAALHAEINTQLQVASGNVLDRTYRLADDMLSRFKAEMQQYAKPVSQILAVKVNGELVQLGEQASPVLGEMIVNAKLGLNTMLVGPAGCGKTYAAKQLSKALKRPFGVIQFTAGVAEAPLAYGRQFADGIRESQFSLMAKQPGVFCFDEFDKANANAAAIFNMALSNRQFKNELTGEMFDLHPDFVIVATANTAGYGGDERYTGAERLDAATLSRFVPVPVDYSAEIEKQLCPDKGLYDLLLGARNKIDSLRANQIICTRKMMQAYARKQAGIPMESVLRSVTLGWPEEITSQCGLDKWVEKDTTKKVTSRKQDQVKADSELAAIEF